MLNQAAPDFTAPRYNGGEARLSDYAGQTLILAFSGLWCPDCIVDGPNLNAVAIAAEASGVSFLYLHSGPSFGRWGGPRRATVSLEDAERAWTAYAAQTGYAYPVAFDLSNRLDIGDRYGVEWYPTNLIIDRQGVIRFWRTDLGADGVRGFLREAERIAAA